MARKKTKPTEAPEADAAEPPQEGTKGVIWGQQVKKPKTAGWVEQLDWHDASPASFDEFLTGAEEGGFMGLEEIDGEIFDNYVGGAKKGTPKDGKKRKAEEALESAVGAKGVVTEKAAKKKKGAKLDVAAASVENAPEDTESAPGKNFAPAKAAAKLGGKTGKAGMDGTKEATDGKGKGKDKKGDAMEKASKPVSGAAAKENGLGSVAASVKSEKAQKPKAKKMTSSEIKKRKKEKRRQRLEQQRAGSKLDPGLFRGVKTETVEMVEEGGAEDLESAGMEADAGEAPGGASGLDGAMTGGEAKVEEEKSAPREAKLSKREKAKKAKGKEAGENGGPVAAPTGTKPEEDTEGQTASGPRLVGPSGKKGSAKKPEGTVSQRGEGTANQQSKNGGLETDEKVQKKKRKILETGADDGPGNEGEEEEEEIGEERRGSGGAAGTPECDVSAWEEFGLHPLLLKGLAKLGFSQPTEIQKQCIPAALTQGKDLVGAAETGSGKTLAFGLPILHRLLQIEEKERKLAEADRAQRKRNGPDADGKKRGSPLRALIMTPTRELALQVCSHLKAAAQETSIRIVAIVGGMAVPKQQRLLRSRPAVVVGTPGRLWELISEGEQHLLQVDDLRFFVLDEADRMVEKGHFKELQSIIDTLPKQGGAPPAESDPPEEDTVAETPQTKHVAQRQTFVFSATLMVPPSLKKKLKGAGKAPMRREQGQVAALIERAGLSRRAAIVDLTRASIVAAKLEEAAIECLETEKDAYLYYLLKMHPSRTIVFCTAISAVRRIAALLQLLQVRSWPLHAQMQQRQRFKAMDRFKKEEHGVLVATDVAARGLDIVGIRCVIHYQLPLSTEIYVHRSGRTARAATDGVSVAIVSPSERPKLNALCKALGKESGLPDFPVNQAYMPAVLERVKLAIKVDGSLRQQQQTKAKRTWLEKHAEELGIELDADELEAQSRTSKKGKVRIDDDKAPAPGDAKTLEAKLRALVKQPLQPRAMHHTYLAGSGISAETVKQLQQAVQRPDGSGAGAIGSLGEEALDALRNKRAKR